MTVNAVSVYAGSSQDTSHTAIVDYFFNTASPIIPEDGPGDVDPPIITGVDADPSMSTTTINWTTDEAG